MSLLRAWTVRHTDSTFLLPKRAVQNGLSASMAADGMSSLHNVEYDTPLVDLPR